MITDTLSGSGGNGFRSLSVALAEGGRSGGSGGKTSVTDSGLAGSTLDITVGAGGTTGYSSSPDPTTGDDKGQSGRVLIVVY